MAWQKRARIAVAIFGIASAGIVYAAIGRRQAPTQPAPVQRMDPKALAESTSGHYKRLQDEREEFDITFQQQLTYENNESKSFGVRIATKPRGDMRNFEVTADKADSGSNEQMLQLSGHVHLKASDGFELSTETAVFNRTDGVVHSDGAVTFSKGRMTGRGTNATYNHMADVLTIGQDAHVEMHDEHDKVTLDFNAGAAALDRMQDLLTLDGAVHVIRDQQVIDGDHAVAHMDSEDQFITLLELRGNARVQGSGGNLDSMSARDMDLHYSPDGKILEHVVLTGGSAIALTGQGNAGGRTITGDAIDLQLAPDGSLTHVTSTDPTAVRLGLPASEGTPARTIQAKTLDATGVEKKGLTSAHFTSAVEFREQSPKPNAGRTVRANDLQVALVDDSVGDAVFTGLVTFEEQGLTASAAELRYAPDAGTLKLSGIDRRGAPSVADDQITIAAETIDVTLEGRHMIATKSVKTTLRPQAPGKGADDGNRLPGLLKQDQAANVDAAALDYEGASGKGRYTGNATLWQGETSVSASTITIDQQKGDLVATGSAVMHLAFDTGDSTGRSYEIRYDDAKRLITYSGEPPAANSGRAAAAAAAPLPASAPAPAAGSRQAVAGRQTSQAPAAASRPARGPEQPFLNGTQGNLQADRIEMALAESESKLDRLEGYGNVTIDVGAGKDDRKHATGTRLTYHAANEQYDITGTAIAPVKMTQSCSEMKGKTVTFYKSMDRIIVDGQDQGRTETKSNPCTTSGARPTTPARR